MKQILSKVRTDLSELKVAYNLDFLTEDRPGFKIVSHIEFSKLPSMLQQERVHRLGTNYRTIKDIVETYAKSL